MRRMPSLYNIVVRYMCLRWRLDGCGAIQTIGICNTIPIDRLFRARMPRHRSVGIDVRQRVPNKIMPGHRKTTLAMARPFSLYFSGLPPYMAKSRCAFAEFVPVTYAL